jgi:soluble lytic murein transglycosylase-like protein
MQLMPETSTKLGVRDPFDAMANLDAGAVYLKQLLDRYKGDLSLALAAYNAGPAALGDKEAVPDIPETRAYVAAILAKLKIKPPDPPRTPTPKPTGN